MKSKTWKSGMKFRKNFYWGRGKHCERCSSNNLCKFNSQWQCRDCGFESSTARNK